MYQQEFSEEEEGAGNDPQRTYFYRCSSLEWLSLRSAMYTMQWPVLALLFALSLIIVVPQGLLCPSLPLSLSSKSSIRLAVRSAPSFTALQIKFQKEALAQHNSLRAKHCTPPLALDDTLSQSAQSYAEKLVALGKMQHSEGDYGENLYSMSSSKQLSSVPGLEKQ